MTRSVWKGPFVHPSLLKKIDKLKSNPNKKPIKTWSRNSTIIPDFVGHSFMIHNGKSFIPITISKRWLAINLENSRRLGHLKVILQQIKKQLLLLPRRRNQQREINNGKNNLTVKAINKNVRTSPKTSTCAIL